MTMAFCKVQSWRVLKPGGVGGGGMAVYGYSGKLKHGPQFTLICSFQKWVGGLYLRALDEKT